MAADLLHRPAERPVKHGQVLRPLLIGGPARLGFPFRPCILGRPLPLCAGQRQTSRVGVSPPRDCSSCRLSYAITPSSQTRP
jgi:hypothetical protein